jgi:hypothetical protein
MTQPICRCHASDLYASLLRCPGCGHRSYDPIAGSCERRACAYEGPPAAEQGSLL